MKTMKITDAMETLSRYERMSGLEFQVSEEALARAHLAANDLAVDLRRNPYPLIYGMGFSSWVQVEQAIEFLLDGIVLLEDEGLVIPRQLYHDVSRFHQLCEVRGCPRSAKSPSRHCAHHGWVAVWERAPRLYGGEVLWEGR